MGLQLLGGLTPARFLSQYWQKKPLLVRQAIPAFAGIVPRSELFRLAASVDVESKLFVRRGSRWTVNDGPHPRAALQRTARLARVRWTLLVHGLNIHVPGADALLREFAFIPYARLDDILVSYAADGGGVGPHFDSYDVFLLQGEGRRRWRISTQRDRTLDPRATHRMLARFHPKREWILEPGDMLYLPPGCAHEGTAIGACTTYSIGFRAPSTQELGTAFLDYLRDNLRFTGMYRDPDLRVQRHPAAIPPAMGRRVHGMLRSIRLRGTDVRRFLGEYLSEPKQQAVFSPPRAPLGGRAFKAAASRQGLRLDSRTLLLFDDTRIYVNGEAIAAPAPLRARLRALADCRTIAPGAKLPGALCSLLHRWYLHGWLLIGERHD
jgi:50S ribosomal protein L16 3-hydroxylase